MRTKIETPEEMAERLDPGLCGSLTFAIRARDDQIAAALEAEAATLDDCPHKPRCHMSHDCSRGRLRANAIRAFAANLRGSPAEPPPTQPGPKQDADMALRFRYWRGVFAVFDGIGNPHIARPENCRVTGLRIRILYEHTHADREAALVCAESWQGRMVQAGAREVVVVGEEVAG